MNTIASAQPWQIVLALAAYIGYLYLVLKGGMKPKPITVRRLLSVPVVMFLATIAAFDGVGGPASWLMLAIAVGIATVQGLLLGHSKIVERRNGTWTVHHGRRYLGIWFSFYALKVVLTALVVISFGEEFHLWFGVFYFLVFSSIRSALVYRKFRCGVRALRAGVTADAGEAA